MGSTTKRRNAPRLAAGVADHYAGRNERIYDLTNGTESGALVSVKTDDDDTIRVDVYRVSGKVLVSLPGRPLALLTERDSLTGGAVPMWTQLTTGGAVQPVGDIGGDFQVSEAYGVRFQHSVLPTCFVEVSWFVEVEDDEVHLSRMWGSKICTDPSDPGGSETWADTRFERLEQPTDRQSGLIRALLLAGAFTAAEITWDGGQS